MRVSAHSHFGEESIYGMGADETQNYAAFTGVINLHDSSGKPVRNGRITLVNKSTMTPFDQRVTDANGSAKITAQIPDPPGLTNLAYRVDKNDAEGMIEPILIDVVAGQGEEPQGLSVDVKVPGSKPGTSKIPLVAIIGGVAILGILGYAFFKK
jgi:hypothetical protein